MTAIELATNLIENDRTGDYCNRKITIEEARQFIEWMECDEDLDVSPEELMEAWNEIV